MLIFDAIFLMFHSKAAGVMEGSTVVVTEVCALTTAQGSLRTNTTSVRNEAKKKKKKKANNTHKHHKPQDREMTYRRE